MRGYWLASAIAALALSSVALAGPISTYPAASALSGSEKIIATQGSATVNVTPDQIATRVVNAASVTGPYTSQVAQTLTQAANSDCINLFSYLTAAEQAAVGAGTSTKDFAPILTAAFNAASFNQNGYYQGGQCVYAPAGRYPVNSEVNVHRVIDLRGAGGGGGLSNFGVGATEFHFAANVRGFIVNRYNTNSNTTVAAANTNAADGSSFSNFVVSDATSTWTDPIDKPAFWLRARASLRNISINWSAGSGLVIRGSGGGGGASEGNANESSLDTINISAGAYGVFTQGADANAGDYRKVGVQSAGLACFADLEFLGSHWSGAHADSCGTANMGRVTYSGHTYSLISSTAGIGASTTPGTNNGIWYDEGAGSGPAAWSGSGTYYPSGGIFADGSNTRSLWDAPYVETAPAYSHVGSPGMVINGNLQGYFTALTPHLAPEYGVGGFIGSPMGVGGFTTLASGDGRGAYTFTVAYGTGLTVGNASNFSAFMGATSANPQDLCFSFNGLGTAACMTGGFTTQTYGRTGVVRYAVNVPMLALGAPSVARVFQTCNAGSPVTTGNAVGERCFNIAASPSSPESWIETTQGSPDTWTAHYIYPRANPTAGIGYVTGAGGAVTQATSRTTGVTLNKVTGAITLVSAAGSATPFTFTLSNSTIVANDTLSVNVQKGATDKYLCSAMPAAGSADITCWDLTGTTSEAITVNFNVIKGAAS